LQILVGWFCVFGGTKSGANITPFPNFLISFPNINNRVSSKSV